MQKTYKMDFTFDQTEKDFNQTKKVSLIYSDCYRETSSTAARGEYLDAVGDMGSVRSLRNSL